MTKSVKIQITLAALLLSVGGFLALFIYLQVSSGLENKVATQIVESEEVFFSPLDGMKISAENKDLPTIGVMIENHPEARPQAGLSKAKIVYEIMAEGDITRFLAIYDLSDNLAKIGPVRSARPYFIDLAGEYKALYAHSGGSPAALSRLRNEKEIFNLDEFFGYNSGYFWRDDKRYAPHNLYTSTELLLQAQEHYDLGGYGDLTSWKFKDGQKASDKKTEIKINYSSATSSQVIWKYLPETNKYERWQNNRRHIDDDGSIIESDNIIIQYAKTKILDEIGRKDIALIGSGQALIFRDNLAIIATWQKKDTGSRTVFYDENNNEVELNRGKTWVEVVPLDLEISY